MVRATMLLSRMKSGMPEIFATVQGEGSSIGMPCVFVRTADCNLRCSWCDTKYTWDWAAYDRKAETVELDTDEVVARVFELAGAGIRRAVFTGGEPLLQQEDLTTVARRLREQGFAIEVETNGTVVPTETFAACVDQWNASPKLAGSGNAERARRRPAALEWFAAQPSASFKFVVGNDGDLAEANEIVTAFGIPKERVIFSPEGTDTTTLAERSRWLAERCGEHGYRLGTRLHVFLWGSERGR
jgi:7-cyano-7-deazaguanosine (preQ0) biosynthesis protein QueE